MVPLRLLLWSARWAILGSADSALWGELGGPWGKEEHLTWNTGEGMALGLLDSLGFHLRVRSITLGTWGCNTYLQFLFLQIPNYWGLGLPSGTQGEG